MSARRSLARALLLAVMLMSALSGCVTQTRNGPAPPSQAALDAARAAELRYRAKVHTDLAAAYYARSQFPIALEEIESALQSDARFVGAWNLRGLVYMALREDQEAERSFQQGFRIAPSDPELANNYGFFLRNRGREREGLVRLESAIKDPLYQTPEKPLVNAGLCALRVKDDAAAEGWLRRAVQVAPTDPQGAYALAILLERTGRPGEAREFLRPLLRGDAPSLEALQLMVKLDQTLQDPV